MALISLRMTGFRNYRDSVLSDVGRITLLAGQNGSGKTNFLEAVSVLTRGSSFRDVPLTDLIRWETDAFHLTGDFDGNLAEAACSSRKKILTWNGDAVSVRELGRKNPAVFFLPEDIRIVIGTPEEKRSFLDGCLSQLDGDYRQSCLHYHRALQQRNAHLKINAREAVVWNDELVSHGSVIMEKRLHYLQTAAVYLRSFAETLCGVSVDMKYMNPFRIEGSIKDSFRRALEQSARTERERKTTLAGPHRDTVEIRMTDRKVKASASQGQRRVIAVALKLYLAERLAAVSPVKPVLLADDILLELDRERRDGVLTAMIREHQTIYTATDSSLFDSVRDICSVVRVADGELRPVRD